MTSAVDATFPADNVKPAKSGFRQNFQAIKDEIEVLQRQTSLAYRMALDTRLFKEV